jgi:hypothetical protein
MTLRAAYVVIGLEAVVIAGLVAFLLFRATPADAGPGVHDRGSSGHEAEDGERPIGPRPRRPSPATQATDSRAAITPTPYVEADDVVFSPDDPVGIMLFGKVTTADGKPPKDEVHVSIEDDETGDWRSSQVKSAAYAISGLRPGAWNLVFRNRGYREIRQTLKLEATSPRQRLDLVVTPCATLKVKIVTPEGKLIQEALQAEQVEWNVSVSVVATLAPPPGDLPLIVYRGHDDYGVGQLGGSVPKGYSAVLELREGPPVYVSAVMRHVVLATKHVPAGAEEAEIVVPTSAVKGKLAALKLRLVDADTGAPVTKARVEANDRQSGGPEYPIDENGNVFKEGLRPGLQYFSVIATGYEYLEQFIRLEPGQVNDLGTLRLAKAVVIEGKVVDERGAPLEASISYRNLDRMEFPQSLQGPMGYRTEPDGTFKIDQAGRGRGVLIATTKEQVTAAVPVDTTGGPVSNARIVVRAATRVALEAKFGRGEQYLLVLVDEGGTPWMSSNWAGSWTMRLQLPPGSYTLRVHDEKTLRRSIPITVGATPLRVPVTP